MYIGSIYVYMYIGSNLDYYLFNGNWLLPPFHIIRLSSIAYIHIDINESRHICVPRFINIYTNVGNARKFL